MSVRMSVRRTPVPTAGVNGPNAGGGGDGGRGGDSRMRAYMRAVLAAGERARQQAQAQAPPRSPPPQSPPPRAESTDHDREHEDDKDDKDDADDADDAGNKDAAPTSGFYRYDFDGRRVTVLNPVADTFASPASVAEELLHISVSTQLGRMADEGGWTGWRPIGEALAEWAYGVGVTSIKLPGQPAVPVTRFLYGNGFDLPTGAYPLQLGGAAARYQKKGCHGEGGGLLFGDDGSDELHQLMGTDPVNPAQLVQALQSLMYASVVVGEALHYQKATLCPPVWHDGRPLFSASDAWTRGAWYDDFVRWLHPSDAMRLGAATPQTPQTPQTPVAIDIRRLNGAPSDHRYAVWLGLFLARRLRQCARGALSEAADGAVVAALSDVGTEFLNTYERTSYGRATTPEEVNALESEPLPPVEHGFRSCTLCDALEYAQCQPNQGAFMDCEDMEHDHECPEDAAERTEPYVFPPRERN